MCFSTCHSPCSRRDSGCISAYFNTKALKSPVILDTHGCSYLLNVWKFIFQTRRIRRPIFNEMLNSAQHFKLCQCLLCLLTFSTGKRRFEWKRRTFLKDKVTAMSSSHSQHFKDVCSLLMNSSINKTLRARCVYFLLLTTASDASCQTLGNEDETRVCLDWFLRFWDQSGVSPDSDVAGSCRSVTACQWLSFCRRERDKGCFTQLTWRGIDESSLRLAVGNTDC